MAKYKNKPLTSVPYHQLSFYVYANRRHRFDASVINFTCLMTKLRCTYPNCTKAYASRSTLRRHLEAFHYRIHRFLCPQCPKSYAYEHTLRNHAKKHEYRNSLESVPKLTLLLRFSHDPDLRLRS